MPLPSYQELRKEVAHLRKLVTRLSFDTAYGITTRPAIENELRTIREKFGKRPEHVIFFDIDACGMLNAIYGYESVNKKIKRALQVRSSDILLRARWFSGDEIVIILEGGSAPDELIDRLRKAFAREGISATFSHTVYTGDLESDVSTCAAVVQARKTGYQV